MFGLAQPQCNIMMRLLSGILQKTLQSLKELPDRNSFRMVSFLENHHDVLLDGTERPVQRPQDSEVQKTRYSGKKTHSEKHNLLSSQGRRILWLSRTCGGSVRDENICDEQPLSLPNGATLWQDAGFVGRKPENVQVEMPEKANGKRTDRRANKEQQIHFFISNYC